MSLATRCMHCGTVFRVVQDQLKVSEGWVRCGKCNSVFNALDGLFDLDREAPPDWPAPEGARAAARAVPAPDDALPEPLAEPQPDPHLVDKIAAEVFGGDPRGLTSSRELPAPAAAEAPAAEPQASAAALAPEFVRRAEADERWRRSPRRIVLAATAGVLVILLALQWVAHFRDSVASRWPAAASMLAGACASFGCTLGAPKRLDALAVESSALARTPAADEFRLSVTLRNRDDVALALPSIELALTDAAGALVARRVLAPADFRVAAPVIAAGAEQTLQLVLLAAGGRVSGYTVEIFYP